jgi:hypothetical protein
MGGMRTGWLVAPLAGRIAGVSLEANSTPVSIAKAACPALPLGGRYWVGDMTGHTQVPGMGRSLYTGMTFEF